MMTYLLRETVEQFHLLFLDQLGRKLDKNCYGIKGGCNLRFFLKSIRYSEDMDIDIIRVGKETLEKKVNVLLASTPFQMALKSKQITILEVSTPKQTQTTQRWKVQLKHPSSELPINTKIEFSRRNDTLMHTKVEVVDPMLMAHYQLTPILASHYSAEVALLQKIKALAGRVNTQSRDVFDIFHLLNMGTKLLAGAELDKELLTRAEENAMALGFADFKGHVLAYLPHEQVAVYDSKEMWETIVLKVVDTMRNY